MQANIMGWDIGGAHLKAAVVQPPNTVLAVYQCSCPLWQGLDKLSEAIENIQKKSPYQVSFHALTMTGELVDLFSDRDDGVRQILALMGRVLHGSDIQVYTGKQGFVALKDVSVSHYPDIASTNWLASATLAAQKVGSGLFVDIGSTTTDILAFADGKVLAEGFTDYERLVSQELVYTGIVRTPVMALVQSVQDEGKQVGIMAEYFATMADVYRVTGELNEAHDQAETTDGKEKTVAASAKRLARMVGCDYAEEEHQRWLRVAAYLRQQQVSVIQQACASRSQQFEISSNISLIGAGIGRFLVKDIAKNMGLAYQDFSELLPGFAGQSGYDSSDCAPAVAVASLLATTMG